MKSKRQNEIIEIISTADIETQEELAAALRERGYPITQATVSRDIRELRLIKVTSKSGGYKYAKPVRSCRQRATDKDPGGFADSCGGGGKPGRRQNTERFGECGSRGFGQSRMGGDHRDDRGG